VHQEIQPPLAAADQNVTSIHQDPPLINFHVVLAKQGVP
jgi:hypothetical protein